MTEQITEENVCIFCGSDEEVSLIPLDTPTNIQPVCIACYESSRDASLSDTMYESERR